VEIECFLPQRAINELGISIGGYHHGHPLPSPFPPGWTAEQDASLRTDRRGYLPVEIVSPILQGRAGVEQVKQVAQTLKTLGACVNTSAGYHYVERAIMLSDWCWAWFRKGFGEGGCA